MQKPRTSLLFTRAKPAIVPLKFDREAYLSKVKETNFDVTPVGVVLAAHAAKIAAAKDDKTKERYEKIASRVESALQTALVAGHDEKLDRIVVINKKTLKL